MFAFILFFHYRQFSLPEDAARQQHAPFIQVLPVVPNFTWTLWCLQDVMCFDMADGDTAGVRLG